jgi:hypothetical protein
MKPKMRLARVVFPLPLSPAIAVMVAGCSGMVRLKFCKATSCCPGCRKPPPINFCSVADFQKGLGHKRLSPLED